MEIKEGGPPHLFRYRSDSHYTLDELKYNYIYFSDRDELNDPYDSTSELIKLTDNPEELEKIYNELLKNLPDQVSKEFFARKYSPENIAELISENIEPFLMQFGISCFSIKPVILPLWTTYSNNYKGICLQFNSDYDTEFFKELRPVLYERDLKKNIYIPLGSSDELIKLFYRKSELWSKEFELRLIKKTKGKIKFKKSSLRSVILGYKIEPDFRNEVIQIIKENYSNVNIYQMNKPKKLNSIRFTLL